MIEKVNIKYRIYFLFFLVIPIPLFFNLNGTVFTAGSLDFDAFGLPFSLLFLGLVTLYNIKKIDFLFHIDNLVFFLFIMTQLMCYLIYTIAFFSNGDPLLLVISIIPLLLSYKIGFNINKIRFYFLLEKYVRKAIMVCGVFSLLHLLSSFFKFGLIQSFVMRGNDDIFGLFSIYQKLIYYPTILALFFVLSLFQKGFKIRVFSVFIFLTILMVGSREPLLIISCGFLSKVLLAKLFGNYKYLLIFVFSVLFLTILSIYYMDVFFENFSESGLVTKLRKFEETGDYSAGRFDVIIEVFKINNVNMFLGTGYSTQKEILSPHNQYLEFYVRSGVISAFLFLFLLAKTYKNIFNYIRLRDRIPYFKTIFSLIVVFCIFTLIPFNVNTPIRAPYSSCLFGLLLGFFNKNIINEYKKSL